MSFECISLQTPVFSHFLRSFFLSLPALGIPKGSGKSQSCDARFADVSSPSGVTRTHCHLPRKHPRNTCDNIIHARRISFLGAMFGVRTLDAAYFGWLSWFDEHDVIILPVRNSMEFSPSNRKFLSICSQSPPWRIHYGAHRFPYKLHRLPKGTDFNGNCY